MNRRNKRFTYCDFVLIKFVCLHKALKSLKILTLYFFFFHSATAMMAGNPAVIQSMVKEHEDHVKKVFKHIDDMAKKHDVRTYTIYLLLQSESQQ